MDGSSPESQIFCPSLYAKPLARYTLDDAAMKESERKPSSEEMAKGSPALAKASSPADAVVPELIEVLRHEGGHVDVNVLLVQLVQKSPDPRAMLESAKELLVLAREYEEQSVENFSKMANAVIDAKTRDPEEVDKRRNNRMRRCLKAVIGVCALGGLGAGTACAIIGAPVVVTGLLLGIGGIAVAMSGPLAAGESISANDVTRIIRAMGARMLGGVVEEGKEPPQKRKQGK